MDPSHPTDTNSQEQEKMTESGKETRCAILTGNEKTEETSRNDDGSEIKNDVEANGEEKHLEKDHKGSSRTSVEDEKDPENFLKEIQMQKTHDLYCPNCTHNITGTAKLFEKGEETFPYNKEKFLLSFLVVISFKYPFIYLRRLYNNAQESVRPIQPKTRPLPQAPSGPKPDNTLGTLLVKIREKLFPKSSLRLSPTSQRFILVLVLLLLSVILFLTLPSRPPPPPQRPGENVSESEDGGDSGGGFSFSWLINLLSNNYVSVISLLFLAILVLLWRSMIGSQETDPQKTGAATNPQKLDDGTDQAKASDNNSPVKEVIPKEKPKNNGTLPALEDEKEDSLNKEGDDISPASASALASSVQLLPIKLDILKSIVYGGLIESITSFGVVSSAAASGTSTLNVMALGLANLFSGLLIIIHNLYGLFRGPRYQSWNNDHMPELVAVDPYEELLGKRNRVILHCFVVLISFVFFGVIPPIFYGFSFKITDKGHYEEAAVVVAASLVCVISLSFAKAYAFGMDKVKTVAAYTGTAVIGSALSFIASQHARDVFAKYDFHKLASDYLKG